LLADVDSLVLPIFSLMPHGNEKGKEMAKRLGRLSLTKILLKYD
jgi:hypothetical protein